jgi:hypothetical protein
VGFFWVLFLELVVDGRFLLLLSFFVIRI